jgi:elongation factor G
VGLVASHWWTSHQWHTSTVPTAENVTKGKGWKSAMTYRTVNNTITQQIRHVNQSAAGGSFLAIFSIRIDFNVNAEVVFINDVKDTVPPDLYAPFIEQGISEYLKECSSMGEPIKHLRITLVENKHHPIDSNSRAYIEAGRKIMENAIVTHGVRLRDFKS